MPAPALTYVVEPHPEGGWRLTGGNLSERGLWYTEAGDAASYAKFNATGCACRIELRNKEGRVLKVREHPAEKRELYR